MCNHADLRFQYYYSDVAYIVPTSFALHISAHYWCCPKDKITCYFQAAL